MWKDLKIFKNIKSTPKEKIDLPIGCIVQWDGKGYYKIKRTGKKWAEIFRVEDMEFKDCIMTVSLEKLKRIDFVGATIQMKDNGHTYTNADAESVEMNLTKWYKGELPEWKSHFIIIACKLSTNGYENRYGIEGPDGKQYIVDEKSFATDKFLKYKL